MTTTNDAQESQIPEETILSTENNNSVAEQSATQSADATVLSTTSSPMTVPQVALPPRDRAQDASSDHAADHHPSVPLTQPAAISTDNANHVQQSFTPAQSSTPVQSPAAAAQPEPTVLSHINPTPLVGVASVSAEKIAQFHDRFNAIVTNVSQVVVGKEQPVKQCVTALVAGGHILLEDNPGTGKTQLARGMARSIDTSFKRIQFTPDLLPSDVVGVTFYDQKTGEFSFREGPVFASIVLADEINRASPKTQSALLEVMEEQKVTVDGVTYDVPQPFIVIATQNPVEQLGTYKLPEAQMDRFLIKTTIGYPSHQHSLDILKQVNIADRAASVGAVATGQDILDMRAIAEEVHVDDAILEYIVRLTESTRHNENIAVGSSMRGALALTRCARVWAAADNRGYVIPDDVKELAVPVLAHRVVLTSEALFTAATAEEVLTRIIEEVPSPTQSASL